MTKTIYAVPILVLAACNGGGVPSARAPSGNTPSTIDARIQRIADEEADRVAKEWGAPRAVIVVIDPKTGAVLASAGRDGDRRDPSLASTRAWVTGSTMKSFTIAAALEER